MTYKIKHRDELLADIAAQLGILDRETKGETKLGCIEVVLYVGKESVLTTGLATALDYLANDIFWNEDADWANADRAEVRTV